ncbi:MAG: metal ABC transporter substrate-binding protein [Planctomycetota bacterium]|nr:metal ABC transporter substrate-binding protein [Planctomycetota bacterium]
MAKQLLVYCVVVISILVSVNGCQNGNGTPQDNSPFGMQTRSNLVSTVSYPLYYMTQRIAGDSIAIELIAPPERAPDQWTPDQKQIQTLQESDLIIANGPGAPFAQWMVRVSLPESRICHTTDNLDLQDFISVKDYRVVHRHGPEGEHSHPFMVAQTWLDPKIARKQADQIAAALESRYPEKAAIFQENRQGLDQDLDRLANRMKSIPGGEVLTSTPRLKFLTRAAGLTDTHLLWFDLPDKKSWSEKGEQDFLGRAKQSSSKSILFDTVPPGWFKNRLEGLGYQTYSLDSFSQGGLPEGADSDFIRIMDQNLETLQSAVPQ